MARSNYLFWPTPQAAVLGGVGVTEEQLFGRYDGVIHLASTAADSEYEKYYDFGEGSNNPIRFHTPSQAKTADAESHRIYCRHSNFVYIGNQETFAEKIQNAVKASGTL